MEVKKNMKNENGYKKIGYILGLVFTIVVVVVWMVNNPITENFIENFNNKKDGASWKDFMRIDILHPLFAEGNPGAGASGFLEIFIINHSADKYYTQENTSATLEGHCTANGLGYANADNVELDIAHSTLFDIVIKVRGNATHCKRGATWWDTDLNITLTWDEYTLTNDQPDGGTTYPLAAMNTSGYTYLYKIFYWDNGGAGYQLSKGQTTGTDPIFVYSAYY